MLDRGRVLRTTPFVIVHMDYLPFCFALPCLAGGVLRGRFCVCTLPALDTSSAMHPVTGTREHLSIQFGSLPCFICIVF
jgi:hypothetical protein